MPHPTPVGPVPARDVTLDGIRLIAMLCVCTIHIGAKGFGLLGAHWWAINLYESASRVAVPLFFMITGALLLPRVHTPASIWRRQQRILIPLLAWSVLYLLWFRNAGQHHTAWLAHIIQAPVVAHLWYLYTLIGAYLFLPVIAGFYQSNAVPTQVFCLLFCFIGAAVVPLEIALTGHELVGISWVFLTLYAGYMAAGALLYWHCRTTPRRACLGAAIWAACAVAIAVLTWWRSDQLGHADEAFYVYSSPLVVLGALGAFVSLRALFGSIVAPGGRLHGFLTWFGNVSFGIYLLHVGVLFWLDRYGIDYQFTTPWVAIPVLSVATVMGCALVVRALQAIPGVRAIVPG